MPEIAGTRFLFLDDSGKPSFSHPSQALVVAGFSVPSQHVPELCRLISTAKSTLFPERGNHDEWEIKSRRALKSSRRRRLRQTLLTDEIIEVLSQLQCTVYSVSIRKPRMHHEMSLKITMPLQLRVLTEHFAVECATLGEIGVLVSDWSNHSLDSYVNKQLARYVTRTHLPIHPSVYFADSLGSPAIQVADLIAGARRKSLEDDPSSESIASRYARIRSISSDHNLKTHSGRPYETNIDLFQ